MQLVSHGTPMILSGDEMGRTQLGNNNAYCQDNEISWINWELLDTNAEIFRFYKNMIAFRKAHPVLRGKIHFQGKDYVGSGYPDISWHGAKAWEVDHSDDRPIIAFLLCGLHAREGTEKDNYIYVAMNMHWDTHVFKLPQLPEGLQ